MSDPQHSRPLWHRPFWRWFFSLHVGLVLLALMTAASIAGTLIAPLERAQALIYYSWWYQALLLALALNMSCATVRTVMEKVIPAGRPRFMRQESFYASAPNAAVIPFTGGATVAAAAFRRRGFKVAVEGDYGYAVKGFLGRWGAPISHLGFVIVLLGGFASKWFAHEAGVWLAEGMATDKMTDPARPDVEIPMGFTLRCEDFDTGFFPKTRIHSHFVSLITALESGRPPRTGAVEVNRSFKVAGWELHQSNYRAIDDWERYQLGISSADSPVTVTLEISPGQRRPIPALPGCEAELSPANPLQWTLYRQGKSIATGPLVQPLTGTWMLRAEQFEPDFVMDGKSIGSRSQNVNNPALKVMLYEGTKPVYSQWLFGNSEMKEMMRGAMHNQAGPFSLELMRVDGQAPAWQCIVAVRDRAGARIGDYQIAVGQQVPLGSPLPAVPPPATGGWRVKVQERVPAYATYLTLTRNPMVPLVYYGCAVMLLGLMAAFFVRPRQVWFMVDGAVGRLHVAAVYRNAMPELDGATRAALSRLLPPGTSLEPLNIKKG